MDKEKAAKDIDEAKVARDDRLRSCMRKTFGNEEGLVVLDYLMRECGYQTPCVVANRVTQEVYVESTVYNAARQNIYIALRRYLTPNILIPVEIEGLTQTKKPITKKRKAAK